MGHTFKTPDPTVPMMPLDATPAWYVNSDKSDNTMKVILLDFKKLPPELLDDINQLFSWAD